MSTNGSVLYPELSYQIIGACFDAFNEIGSGHKERIYQKAVATNLLRHALSFKEQVHCPLECAGIKIGDYFLDFLVCDLIILELKVGAHFRKKDFDQVKSYLSKTQCMLGILVRFSDEGVVFHRVLRPFHS